MADDPRRIGNPLRDDMAGLWSARRGAYRVLYQLEETGICILIVRIAHRGRIYPQR